MVSYRCFFAGGFVLSALFFLEVFNIIDLAINDEIREKEVRVIGSQGEQLGIVPIDQALRMADQADLDLCLISPKAVPPVCKIMDYGKYRFEAQKKEKESRKNQKIIAMHEIQLSATIEKHDMEVKAKKAREFLKDGDRVKVSIRFRARQITHPEIGHQIMSLFCEMLKDDAKVEKKPALEGRNLIMIMSAI
jgi:translation initiation factor IF-3